MFGVSANTVRNWSRWHGNHLDDAATPGPGATRLFSARDVQVLKQVNELRNHGMTTDEINERLASMRFPIVTEDEADVEAEFSPPAPTERHTEPLAPLLQNVVDQRTRIDEMDARVRRIEQQGNEWRAVALILGIAFVITFVVLMLVLSMG